MVDGTRVVGLDDSLASTSLVRSRGVSRILLSAVPADTEGRESWWTAAAVTSFSALVSASGRRMGNDAVGGTAARGLSCATEHPTVPHWLLLMTEGI